jgi:hypothetical protein
MPVTFSYTYGHITYEAISRAETFIGHKLPDDYVTFLLTTNGGRPSLDKFPIDGHESSTNGVVDSFFGIHDGRFNNLEKYYAMSRGRVRDDMLPIAFDRAGNLLCIELVGEKTGYVFFWDHEREGLETDPSENLFSVAASFSDLLSVLF